MKICDSGAMSSIVSSISMLMLDFEQVAHIINSHLFKAGDSRCLLPLEKKNVRNYEKQRLLETKGVGRELKSICGSPERRWT